jgi:mannose-6-phosphate isomerase-like protein (cupin superfamily)
MEAIEKLKAYYELMPDHTPGILNGNILELESENGVGYCIGLKKNHKVAVADTIVSKGSVFVKHFHVEKEVMIIYDGHLRLTIHGCTKPEEVYDLYSGDFFVLEANTPHNSEAMEDTKLIAITIPASTYFPEGPKT